MTSRAGLPPLPPTLAAEVIRELEADCVLCVIRDSFLRTAMERVEIGDTRTGHVLGEFARRIGSCP